MSKERFGRPTIRGNGGQIMQGGKNNSQTYEAAPAAQIDELLSDPSDQSPAPGGPASDQSELERSIFVVYGRDVAVTGAVFQLLRGLDLKPLEWESLVRGTNRGITPPLSEVVISAPRLASAAVVVLTPDDRALLHAELRKPNEDRHELHPMLQPRPNVLVELGIALGVYAQRTLILEFGDLRPIADLNGLNAVRFNQHTDYVDALRKIAGRLKQAGLPVDDSGSDWLNPTPFQNLPAYRRRPV